MKVVVTGGAGFIGSHVVEKCLNLGFNVVVLDNFSTGRRQNLASFYEDVELIECDLSVDNGWSKSLNGADWVIHLAALADIVPSIQNPTAYFNANVIATLNILEAVRKYSCKKLIYAASSSCYGLSAICPTPETAPISPQYPYALSKRLGEEMVLHWAKIYGTPATSTRFFNVYGTRSRTSGTYGAVFGVFLAQKLAGMPFTIVGDGEQVRDFTYVTDVADALIAVCRSETSGEVFNVGSGITTSVNRIAELLGGPKIHIPKRPGEPDKTHADVTKINSELGWSPKISIETGVKRVLDNIDYWAEAVVWTPEKIEAATTDWFKYLGE